MIRGLTTASALRSSLNADRNGTAAATMLIDAEYTCAYCGSTVPAGVDPSAGRNQSYTEDCQVCCRPNLLHVVIDFEDGPEARIDAEPEMDLS